MSQCTPRIIAHRGLRSELPENTVVSIGAALDIPAIYGVEFDVEISADGQALVLHQETLVPNQNFTRLELAPRDFTSRNWVATRKAADIARLDAGSWLNPAFAAYTVPLLSEVLGLNWRDKIVYAELKDPSYWGQRNSSYAKEIVTAALPPILSSGHRASIISFNPEILRLTHELAPQVPLVLALWTEWIGRKEEALRLAQQLGATAIMPTEIMAIEDPSWVIRAHDTGLEFLVYPVSPTRNEPEYDGWTASAQHRKWVQLTALKVDGIITDFSRAAIAALQAK